MQIDANFDFFWRIVSKVPKSICSFDSHQGGTLILKFLKSTNCNKLIFYFHFFAGKSMYAYQNIGWLLLLCIWFACQPTAACIKLYYDGAWYDWGHQVSVQTDRKLRRQILSIKALAWLYHRSMYAGNCRVLLNIDWVAMFHMSRHKVHSHGR